jgi:molybdate transport system permease protein
MGLTLSNQEFEIVLLSLRVCFASVLFSLPFAIACAWLLARKNFPGKAIFDALIHLPLVLPPVVIGFLLLVAFGNQGVIGRWLNELFGVSFAFRWTGAAFAAAVMGFPLMVRAIRLSIESVSARLEAVAQTLGASPLRVFRTITLPLALPGIVAGTLLAFARALGEFGATITFVSNIPGETQTLPLAIYSLTQTPGSEAALWRLCAISVALSLLALLTSEWLTRRARRINVG